MTIDTTWLSVAMAAFSAYYVALFVLVRVRRLFRLGRPRPLDRDHRFAVVVVIPAHNEELVIANTLDALLEASGVAPMVLVMNDGSTDRTSEIARSYEATGAVWVVDRPKAYAGQGKGAVLNHAFRVIQHLLDVGHPMLAGRTPADVVVAVMDADGALQPHALSSVLPYFADPAVGGVQIGVAIANATSGLLPRMQDIEFVGFSGYVQEARDSVGSVGLGGNGQFTRLSALISLGREPWSDCLTEDLDLGLALVEGGWRLRFCPNAYVLQQGVARLKPLLRQRARWFQGHYQCWSHLSEIARSPNIRLRTKIDLSLYLVMVVFVLVITGGAVLGVATAAGLVVDTNDFLARLPSGVGSRLVIGAMSIAPAAGFMWTYQRRSLKPLAAWEVPAYAAAFVLYTYLMVVSQFWAWARMVGGRANWAKTARVAVEPAEA